MAKDHKSKKSSKDNLKNSAGTGQQPKKSKKSTAIKIEVMDDMDEFSDSVTYENNNDIELKHKSPNKSFKDEPNHNTNNISTEKENINSDWNSVDWPEKDLIELFRRMEISIPEKDSLVYSTRIEKLNWEEIAFDNHTGEECKRTWLLIQKRLRKYRLLNELLKDAKIWMAKPWTNFYKGNKNKRHPDMPRRPLSSYMLYYVKKKNKVQAEHPNMDLPELSKKIAAMYKNLSPTKRQKYDKLSVEKKKEYDQKLMEFHRLHPEIERTSAHKNTSHKTTSHKATSHEVGIKKPSTPFYLYYMNQLQNAGNTDKAILKEQCKAQWKAMSDKKKVVWIDWALEEEAKYNDEVKNYTSQNPNYVPSTSKPILTKEEKLLKERVAGKPTKPPMSAYSLFSRMLLKSDDIKRIPVKERMNYIAIQWKNCSDDDKRVYRDQVAHLLEQYKLDYASYLESLPEDKRDEELQKNVMKRKAKKSNESELMPKKKKMNLDIFKNEPEKPAKTSFLLFCKTYNGKKSANDVWKCMSKSEHEKYELKLDSMKKAYLVEFKKFLESLNKKQLKQFADMRKSRKGSENEDDDNVTDQENDNREESSDCSSDES